MNVSSTLSAIYYIAEHAMFPVSKNKLEMMLYTADRCSVCEHGWTITEDSIIIVDGAPVLENLHDMLEGSYLSELFNKLFTVDPLRSIRPFTYDYLSMNDLDLIQESCDKWVGEGDIYSDSYIHELLKRSPEMNGNPSTIDWVDVLVKNGCENMVPIYMDLSGMLDTDAEIDEMLSYIQ